MKKAFLLLAFSLTACVSSKKVAIDKCELSRDAEWVYFNVTGLQSVCPAKESEVDAEVLRRIGRAIRPASEEGKLISLQELNTIQAAAEKSSVRSEAQKYILQNLASLSDDRANRLIFESFYQSQTYSRKKKSYFFKYKPFSTSRLKNTLGLDKKTHFLDLNAQATEGKLYEFSTLVLSSLPKSLINEGSLVVSENKRTLEILLGNHFLTIRYPGSIPAAQKMFERQRSKKSVLQMKTFQSYFISLSSPKSDVLNEAFLKSLKKRAAISWRKNKTLF